MDKDILIISRDTLTTDLIMNELSYSFLVIKEGGQALDLVKENHYRLAIIDLSTPSHMAIYQELRRLSPTLPIILTSNDKSAIKNKSEPSLVKPMDIASLDNLIRQAKPPCQSFHMIAESPSMQKILCDVKKLAKSSASVFICGESGTGKEMIAGAIHHYSNRKTAPFIRVNCAALPETLIESELFGHEKGSFTGAHARRLGRFELADKGTLLLDEVTEIPLTLQSKLLRAIQEQEFERIGSMKSITVDVRLIATSNRDMKQAIKDKAFRDDLYYRLNVLPIYVPPLRDRHEDILPLANAFLENACLKNNVNPKTLSEEAKQKLLAYPWPGNIRELSNVIEHAVIMSQTPSISSSDLILEHKAQTNPIQLLGDMQRQMTFKEMEKWLIKETLKVHNGNRTRTAKALGISIRTLRNKLKTYPELA